VVIDRVVRCQVGTSMWYEPLRRVRDFPVATLVYGYLASCPSGSRSMSGIFKIYLRSICRDLGMGEFPVTETLKLLHRRECSYWDQSANLVWIPQVARWRVGERLSRQDRRGVALVRDLLRVEGHPFFHGFLHVYGEAFNLEDTIDRYRNQRSRRWSRHDCPAVFARDNYACRYCGSTNDLSIDHVVPRAQGGGDGAENLAVACRSCNCRKGPLTPAQAGMKLRSLDIGD
jgi:hypothetical protein